MKTIKTTSKSVALAIASLLATGVAGIAVAGETIDHGGVKFGVSDRAQSKVGGEVYEHAGIKFRLSSRVPTNKATKTYEHAGQKFAVLNR